MTDKFIFFQKNTYKNGCILQKNRCRLEIGSTFIFQGYYCIVSRMLQSKFIYWNQGTEMNCYMDYQFYLSTPSAKGRKLN